jgi:F-type H+-transporting ATPase subunit a
MSATRVLLADTDIKIGEHDTATFLGMTVNVDTIISTLVAGGIVILLGLLVARSASARNPGKVQLIWEALVDWVTTQVEANLGKINRFVVQLSIALFAFILIANWLELIPTQEKLKSPTADVNLTYALALLVIVGVHIHSFRSNGARGYFRHYTEPYKALAPILVIEEIVKPFTLALRLFGNIFSGGIMLAIIGLLPVYILWGPNAAWKLFDMAIGVIQAFIFALLTILYFGMASAHDEALDEAYEAKTEMAADKESKSQAPQLEGAH